MTLSQPAAYRVLPSALNTRDVTNAVGPPASIRRNGSLSPGGTGWPSAEGAAAANATSERKARRRRVGTGMANRSSGTPEGSGPEVQRPGISTPRRASPDVAPVNLPDVSTERGVN